jgi:hypothetical protein
MQNAARFAHRGLSVSPKPNVTGSHFHREVYAGPVVLTESFAESPGALVQQAQFRDTLAREAQMNWLEPEEERSVIPLEDRVYGIVLHGVRRVGPKQRRTDDFGFLQLAIPNKECTKYLAVYNLAQRYASHEVEPDDIAAMMERGVPIEPQRPPSSVFRQYRRRSSDDGA